MATRTITETDCDRCDKKNVPVRSFRIETHREPDPTGGRSEACGKQFDLCLDCMAAIISENVRNSALGWKQAPETPVQFLERWKIKRTTSW